ncbi:hypothetical protein LJC13_03110, partial [Peptostreptococcaceae bacterium OttesenSCG-928-C18]|nr:hypothetical protein [Peptostreptococcaceae bacterium OttesenSCG-928-C18]
DINTLILDEPTNHLDIMSREMLEDTLVDFKGTLIFISHDRYFINKLSNIIFELSNKRLSKYLGDYDYYISEKLREADVISEVKVEKNLKEKVQNKIKKSKPNPIKIRLIEEEISMVEEKIAEIEREIEIYSSDFETLEELLEKKGKLDEKHSDLMAEWIKLNE